MGRQLAIEGTARPRKRERKAGFTKAKEARFLALLTESCNARYAAAETGVAVSTVYRRKAADATFRAAWEQAIGIGYSQLEMMMLERALHGVEKPATVKAGGGVMRQYDDRTALALLKLHRESAAAAPASTVQPTEHEEACERIIARLARLKERLQGSIETKSSDDGRALIRWALERVGRGR